MHTPTVYDSHSLMTKFGPWGVQLHIWEVSGADKYQRLLVVYINVRCPLNKEDIKPKDLYAIQIPQLLLSVTTCLYRIPSNLQKRR